MNRSLLDDKLKFGGKNWDLPEEKKEEKYGFLYEG